MMNNNTPKKAILYLRVSTEEQVENFSLGTQEEICKREATYRGYSVDKIFREEGRSAKTIKGRNVLIKLLEYCRKNSDKITAVFIYKTDRLSRQIYDYLVIQQKLTALGIKIISATEPSDDTAMGRFLANFYAQIAQFDNDIRSERARIGMRARFNAGLFHTGRPPIGYISFDGVVVKDPKTFDKLKTAWNLMSTGTKSQVEMARLLNGEGIALSRSAIHRMFRSKFYAGIIYSPTYQEEVQGQYIPMITRELYDKVQVILDGRSTNKLDLTKRNRLRSDFPLRRFIKCGKCGLNFTGSWNTGRGGKYAYYFCRKNQACNSPYVSVKRAHEALFNLLKKVNTTPEGKAIFLLFLKREFGERSLSLKQKELRRNQQLKKLRDLQSTLVQKHLSGIYSDEIYKEQNEIIEKNVNNIQTLSNNKLIQKYNIEAAIKYVTELMNNLLVTYQNIVDLSQKKDLLSLIFPHGFVWNYPGLTYPNIHAFFKKTN